MNLTLPAKASGRLTFNPIENPEQILAMTPLHARDSEGVIQQDGRVIYHNAFSGTDLVATANHNRLAYTLVIQSERSPAAFRWQVDMAGLRQVASRRHETTLVDANGHLRLSIGEVTITGADGEVRTTELAVNGNGVATLEVDANSVSYPAVAQFELVSAPIALAIIPPEIIKARMMVMVDTSSSMIWGFDANGMGFGTNAGGDSPAGGGLAVYCDNNLGSGFNFACENDVACSIVNGGRNLFPVNNNNTPSRLMATKGALQNVVNAHAGLIDFGLMRFRENTNTNVCPDPIYCCQSAGDSPDVARCTNGSQAVYTNWASGSDITYSGQADNSYCSATQTAGGGRVLAVPGIASALEVRNWVDYVEDTCSATGVAGGPMRNPELRADGYTPLAYSINTARTDWYQPIYNMSKPGGCDPNNANCDPLLDCRPYVLVVLTDGTDFCGAGDQAAPNVAALRDINDPDNPVTIYTMGMGAESGLDIDVLNDMADAGGPGAPAPIAQDQAQIEAAFADIVAETVKFEVCNGQDDNCNDRIDEGLNVYQECAGGSDCGSNNCDSGRCGCSSDDQCSSGYSCAMDGFCRPACAVGSGLCRNTGVRKCSGGSGQCCVDDGLDTCTALSPLPGAVEECNRLDDDCDGEIDEGFPLGCPECIPRPEVCNGVDDDCDNVADEPEDLVGVGAPCGTNEGVCTAGIINCVNGNPVCENEETGANEVCNGLDDDCNGKVDGQTQACYTGPNGTEDVGVCHGGTQKCQAPPGQKGVACTGAGCWGDCLGEVTPSAEICDGLDNDCDAATDEGVPVNAQTCTDDAQCLGSNNCNNGVCNCDAGSCSSGYICGGDNTCYEPDTVTGDQCCDINFADKCGIGECRFGTWVCAGNRVSCIDSVGPTDEVCDGLDNDCDGEIDEELPGIGEACEADGGACGGRLACVVEYDDNDQPIGGAIVCVADDEGQPEICDGIDNDCDNEVDEVPDIYENDMTGTLTPEGVACNEPPEGMREGMCRAGTFQCIYGQIICADDVQPGTEQCNGIDDDCDGEVDENTCPPDGTCLDGVCRFPCSGGEFPCPVGEVCVGRLCIPEEEVTSSGSGGSTSGSGGSGNANSSGGTSSSGGTTSGSGGSGTGGSGGDGSGGGAGADAGDSSSGGTRASTTSITPPEDDSYKVYGLPTGGGGCSCRVGAERGPGGLSLLLGLIVLGGVGRRRRTSRQNTL